MITITPSELRANQKKYFDLAESQPIYVTRSGKKTIVIRVEDDESFTPEEIRAIKRGLKQIREGKVTLVDDPTTVWESI